MGSFSNPQSFKTGQWEKEERHSNPLTKDKDFDIRIRVHEERFEILVNQQHLADYKHRILYTEVNHLQVFWLRLKKLLDRPSQCVKSM